MLPITIWTKTPSDEVGEQYANIEDKIHRCSWTRHQKVSDSVYLLWPNSNVDTSDTHTSSKTNPFRETDWKEHDLKKCGHNQQCHGSAQEANEMLRDHFWPLRVKQNSENIPTKTQWTYQPKDFGLTKHWMNTNVEECAGFNKTNFVKQSTALVFGGRGSVIHHIEGEWTCFFSFFFSLLWTLPPDSWWLPLMNTCKK